MMIRGRHISGLDEPGVHAASALPGIRVVARAALTAAFNPGPRGKRCPPRPRMRPVPCRRRGGGAVMMLRPLIFRRRGPTSQPSLRRAAASAGDTPAVDPRPPPGGRPKSANPTRHHRCAVGPTVSARLPPYWRPARPVTGDVTRSQGQSERRGHTGTGPLSGKSCAPSPPPPPPPALSVRSSVARLGARRATCVRAGSRDRRRCGKRPPAGHSYSAGRPRRPAGLSRPRGR